MNAGTEQVTYIESKQQPSLQAADRISWLCAFSCLFVVFLIANLKVLTGAQVPIWDARAFYGPEFSLVADHARMGRFLLWNPWVASGSPDYADPQVGSASPITVVTAAIVGGKERGFATYWLLVWLLGPIGVLVLARYLQAPPWAGFAIALGYTFCSFYTGHAEHTDFVYAYSFFPFIIWRFETALECRRLQPAAEAGALWGLSALAGYPAVSILNGTFLGLWAIGRFLCGLPLVRNTRSETSAAHVTSSFPPVALLLAFAVGLAVLAPSYFAFLKEGSGYTDRAGPLPRQYAISSNELEPGTLATFASPYLHRLKYPGVNPTLWPKSDVSAMGNYIGVLTLVLALLAIIQRPADPWRWWLLATILFALAAALGDYLPVRGWLYDYYPPTRYFRHAAIFRGYAIFGAVVLAILGAKDFDYSLKQKISRTWGLFCISAVVAVAATLSYHHVISKVFILPEVRLGNTHLGLVWWGTVLISLTALISPGSRKHIPLLFCLVALFDAFYTSRISQPLVADAMFRAPWHRIDAGYKPDLKLPDLTRDLRTPDWARPLSNENIPLRIATAFDNDSPMGNRFYPDLGTHPVLANMSAGLNRIWFAKDVAVIVPSDDTFTAFVARSQTLGAPVVLIHDPASMVHALEPGKKDSSSGDFNAILHLPPAEHVATNLVSYTPNELSFHVTCPEPGWLLITDRWSRGWRSIVNGHAAQVFGGNFVFRAVKVDAGNNEIHFYYRPAGWPWLVLLSWTTLGVVLMLPRFSRCAAYALVSVSTFRRRL